MRYKHVNELVTSIDPKERVEKSKLKTDKNNQNKDNTTEEPKRPTYADVVKRSTLQKDCTLKTD